MNDLRLKDVLAAMGLKEIEKWPSLGDGVYIALDPVSGSSFVFTTAWSVKRVRQELRAHRERFGEKVALSA